MEVKFVGMPGSPDYEPWVRNLLGEDTSNLFMAKQYGMDAVLQLLDVTHAEYALIQISGDSEREWSQQIDFIEQLVQQRPMVSIIALGIASDREAIISAMRAGARDFLIIGQDDKRFLELLQHAPSPRLRRNAEAADGVMTAVFSARPETDTTLLSLHLGLACLHANASRKVLLLDLGYPPGDALLYLGMNLGFDFAEAVANVNRLDSTLVDSAFPKHESGLRILALPDDAASLANRSASDINLTLDVLRSLFDVTIVSMGGLLYSNFLATFAKEAQRSCLVVEQTVPSCNQNVALLKSLLSGRLSKERFGLVLDRYLPRLQPDADTLAASFDLPLLATLPPSGDDRMRAINTGRSLFQIAPHSAYVLRVNELAASLGLLGMDGEHGGGIAKRGGMFRRWLRT